MTIKSQVDDDLKAALLSSDRFKVETLRGLKASILNEEISQKKREEGLSDEVVEQLIAREIKKRNESADQYDSAERPELSEKERFEVKILSEYLPKQLADEEIEVVVNRVISELGVSDMKGMGQVIGNVKKELGNSASGSKISEIVKDKLIK